MNPKQTTLFQSWGSRKSQNQYGSNRFNRNSNSQQGASHCIEDPQDCITISLLDEDDEELAQAMEESLALYQSNNQIIVNNSIPGQQEGYSSTGDKDNDALNISLGIDEQDGENCGNKSHSLSQKGPSEISAEELAGFDRSAGSLWIYPTNYPVREYQYNIVQNALLKNTLVTLPTGLGKTFIASVVMYNFYRWYPTGKVVFMAPTKPLVAQQIEACYNITGIPRQDTAEMTGSMNPTERQSAWQEKRVYFLTPQVMTNDLSRGTCAPEVIKCVVVDEAHKAQGNHAYCQVIRELVKYNRQFRVLALSATPGTDIKSVQGVIQNLLISHVEIRSEESHDIKPYTHERIVDKIVVPLGDELTSIKAKYNQVLSLVVKRLIHQRVLYNREVSGLSKFLILKARDAFRQNPPDSLPRSQYGVVEGDFALAISLYHGNELLQLHGLRSFFNYLEGIINGNKSYGRTRTQLMNNADFKDIMETLYEKFKPKPGTSAEDKPVFLMGHPKMVKLQEVVLEHFRGFEAKGQATRVMIFSQYRDSVQEITTMLQQHEPLVKVMSFIGQSSVGKATKGFTQKEQLKVMKEFRSGGYNTLVSTCVGEEGLDIGDVDLIVCFDAHKSPVRLVQRMGRTGRKRQGRIVMLMTEGKEEQIYNHSQYTKRSIHRAILNGAKSLVFYASNPHLIPAHMTPSCHCMHISVQPQEVSAEKKKDMKVKSRSEGRRLYSAKSASKTSLQEEACISLEEFVELKSLGSAVVARHLAVPALLTGQTDDQLHDALQDGRDSTELDLGEWLPWQTTLQETSVFGHSRRSQHLTELLQFTDLQQTLPPEEDNYGQEMQCYLDMNDVITDPRRPASSDITQFVVPSSRTQVSKHENAAQQKGTSKRDKSKNVTSSTKHSRLPVIDIEEVSSDSDCLPDVDFAVAGHRESVIPDNAVTDEAMDPQAASDNRIEGRRSTEKSLSVSHFSHSNSEGQSRTRQVSGISFEGKVSHADETDGVVFHTLYSIPPAPPVEEVTQLLNAVTPESLEAAEMDSIIQNTKEDYGFIPLQWPGYLSMPDSGNKQQNSIGRAAASEPPHTRNDSCSADAALLWIPIGGAQLLNRWTSYDRDLQCVSYVHADSDMEQETCTDSKSSFDHDTSCIKAIPQQSAAPSMTGVAKTDNITAGFDLSEPQVSSLRTNNDNCIVHALVTPNDGSVPSTGHTDPKVHTSTDVSLGSDEEQNLKKSVTETMNMDECQVSCAGTLEPSKQLHQSETDIKSTSAGAGKVICDALMSESCFLDDGEDFESVEMPHKVSPNPTKDGSACKRKAAGQPDDVSAEVTTQSSEAPVTSPAPSSAIKTPSSQTGSFSKAKNESMFTFTQALACVHNASLDSDFSHSNKTSTEEGFDGDIDCYDKRSQNSLGKQIPSEDQHIIENVSLGQKEGEDSANFDLGFDFDEDIIPPSPETESMVSQLAGKVSFSSTRGSKDAKDGITQLAGEIDDAAVDVSASSGVENHESPCFSSSFQPKETTGLSGNRGLPTVSEEDEDFLQLPTIPPSASKRKLALSSSSKSKQDTSTGKAKQGRYSNSGVGVRTETNLSSQSFLCHTATTESCAVSKVKNRTAVPPKLQEDVSPKLQEDVSPKLQEDVSPKLQEEDFKVSSPAKPQLRLSSIGASHPSEDVNFALSFDWDDDLEEDFSSADVTTKLTVSKETSARPEVFSSNLYCSTPISTKKRKRCLSPVRGTGAALALSSRKAVFDLNLEDDDESDFEDGLIRKKVKKGALLFSDDSYENSTVVSGVQNQNKSSTMKTKKTKKRKAACGFLDDEAELSDDVEVSSDEADDNLELLEGSFIDNNTELTQASQVDMQAVYMKSVRSPEEHGSRQGGRYRLQFNHAPVNVFSQLPPHEEVESQYQEDSFCVGSDEEESVYDSEEDESQGGEIYERAQGDGRKRQVVVTRVKGRKRVRQLADSSSDDNEEFDRLPPSQVTPFHRKGATVKALLSSSDENLEDSRKQISPEQGKSILNESHTSCLLEHARDKTTNVSPSSQGFLVNTKTAGSVTCVSEASAGYDKNPHVLQSKQLSSKGVSKAEEIHSRKTPPFPKQGEGSTFVCPGTKIVHSKPMRPPFQTSAGTASVTSVQEVNITPLTCSLHDDSTLAKKSKNIDSVSEGNCAQSVPCSVKSVSGAGGLRESEMELQKRNLQETAGSGSKFTSLTNQERGKMVILVDSREISGAQDIVSSLRLNHSALVYTRQLSACDYILSNRMAVERFNMSSFSNGANRGKLTERIQQMQSLYDRCVIIVEKDRVKPGEEKNARPQQQSKYVHGVLAQLTMTAVQLFFTENQGETGRLLAQLASVECRKGMAITAPVDLTPHKEQVVKFYLSIPRLTITHALNLCLNFTTIHGFMTSSVNGIQTKGHMSFSRASEVVNYIRHRFSIAMTSGR